MDKLQITIEKQDEDTSIINLKGMLDSTNYFELKKVLTEFIGYKIEKVIVNLAELEYMSSAGVGVFIEAITMVQGYQGSLVLVSPSPSIKTTLDMLKVSDACHLVNSIEEAIKVTDQ